MFKKNTQMKNILLGATLLSIVACNNANNKVTTKDTTDKKETSMSPGSVIKLDSSKRYIFLTWDDGPQPPGTTVSKNVFKQQGIKATFFVVGMNQVGPQKKRIIDSLRTEYPQFLIANHSFSHANINGRDNYPLFYKQVESTLQDFLKNEKEMQVPVKIIRLPGNNAWVNKGQIQGPKSTLAVCKGLDSMGFSVIGWDVEWNQYKGVPKESVAEMIKKVNSKFEEGNTYEPNCVVILSHDRLFAKPQYADSLSKFIATLKQDPRNVFETIDHLPMVMKK